MQYYRTKNINVFLIIFTTVVVRFNVIPFALKKNKYNLRFLRDNTNNFC